MSPADILNLPQVSDTLLLQFLRDAIDFVASSHDAIERSAPHIYLSALPFAAKVSLVYKDFIPQCAGLITVATFGISDHGGRAAMRLTGHSGAVHSLSYSSDGRRLASGSADGTIRIWDTQTGEEALTPFRSGDGSVLSVDFARNNKWVASGTAAGLVYIWDVSQNARSHRLSGHSGAVCSVAFSPDSCLLASASGDGSGTVHVWNSGDGRAAASLRHTIPVTGIVFPPGGKLLATAACNGTISLWNSTKWRDGSKLLQSNDESRLPITATACTVDFSPDGECVAVVNHDAVVLWRCENGKKIGRLQGEGNICCARFSSNGRFLVTTHD